MSRITRSKRRSVPLAALLALLACLLLAACGGSSGSSSTASTNASATSSTSGTGQPAGRKRFTALRECLAKNGITLPKRTPGQAGGGGFLGGAAGGGPQLPKGVTRAQYEAAVKKCGGFAGGRIAPGAAGTQRFKSPAFTQALTKFAACMREKGVKLPTPNTSGKGPIFNTSGLNPASAPFKAAQTKCSAALRGAFRAQPGRTGAPPSAG
ncbi:MAG TPA: hypothetical protein VHT29_05380 [Solirubrobacteraceae bacterium]|jgi:hypothetical protein|nr:hypothetical protein [Solirubrobacteraceae bacterium]